MEEINQNNLKEYLLGSLSDESREQLEKKLMTDDEVYENLEAAESDLIDEYVRNDLSAADRTRFEQHFLAAPDRQENLKFAKAFDRYLQTVPKPVQKKDPSLIRRWLDRSFALQFASAFAVLLVAVGAVWLYYSRTHSPQSFASVTLTMSAVTRGPGDPSTKVHLPLDAQSLRISLKLPAGMESATVDHVELLNAIGETKRLEITDREADAVTVVAPREMLGPGQYALKLFAKSAAGTNAPIPGSYIFIVD